MSSQGGEFLSEPEPLPPAHGGAPWVVVSHDMAKLLRQTDMTIDSSPWRFVFQIRGVHGVPAGISHVVVAWKTRFAQSQTCVAVGSQSAPFERRCLSVDTSFAVDPLANQDEATRDKMLVFSVKGLCGNERDDESAIRLGSFSFRCLPAVFDTAVGQPSRTFKVPVDSSGSTHNCSLAVSLSVMCFPLWMSPAFGSEFEPIADEGDGRTAAQLKDTLVTLTRQSQEYIAARSLLSSGCSNGSIALLDPIFRSPANIAARELLFPAPPFPRCVVDSNFSAVMAPAILQESIAVTIWKYHKLTRRVNLNALRKMMKGASFFIQLLAENAAIAEMHKALRAWSQLREQHQRNVRCAFIWNRSLQRSQSWRCLMAAFQFWKILATSASRSKKRVRRMQFYCFFEWKSRRVASEFKSVEVSKLGCESRLKDAQTTIKDLDRQLVLLKSKIAELSASSALAQGSRTGHQQQLQVSRAAELSAIHRAEHAEEALVTLQLENELLKEQLDAQRELVNCMSSSETSITEKQKDSSESYARERIENERLREENARLRETVETDAREKRALQAEVQSLTAALKQQVTMMMKRNSAAASSHRS